MLSQGAEGKATTDWPCFRQKSMKTNTLLICTALSLAVGLTADCGSKGNDLSTMSKADQEKAFKGDPSKIPADIKEKYMSGKPVTPQGNPSGSTQVTPPK